jgi:hypothetical protein
MVWNVHECVGNCLNLLVTVFLEKCEGTMWLCPTILTYYDHHEKTNTFHYLFSLILDHNLTLIQKTNLHNTHKHQ